MVQKKLFPGQEWRHRCREWMCGRGEEDGGAGRMNWETGIYLGARVCQVASIVSDSLRPCGL